MPDHPSAEYAEHPTPWSRPHYEGQIAMLGRLAEEGLEVALSIGEKAKAADTAEEAGAFALAYARAARVVRLSLMLQAKVIQELETQDKAAAHHARTAACMAKVAQNDRAEARKTRVETIIERIAERADDDAREVDQLVADAAERLDRDDITAELLSRPVSELVAMICRDLGLDPDWPTLAQEAWAREEIAIGPIGWPLAGILPPNPAHPGEGRDPDHRALGFGTIRKSSG